MGLGISRPLLAMLLCALLAAACGGDGEDAASTPAGAGPSATAAAPGGESPECTPARPHVSGDTNAMLAHGGLDRTYILHVPPGYDGTRAVPLVINLHGFSSTARQQALYSRLPPKADAEGFIVLSPDGTGTPARWNNIQLPGGADDVGFIGALLDQLEQQLCIDAARVYAAGMSNGAAFSARLACAMPRRFAAIAPVTALVHPVLRCEAPGPVPVIAFHGTEDGCVPFEGGTTRCGMMLPVPPIEQAAESWARNNGCAMPPASSQVSESVRVIAYSECNSNAEVRLYVIEGGGHTWPGSAGPARLGFSTQEIDATDLIWEFFAAHPREGE